MSSLTTKDFFQKESVKKKFEELLGKRAQQFTTSVLQAINSNSLLQKASPESVYNAATMAAVLDLPINQNLGFAYIVPYKGQAQFQMGWKGFVQLAQRTGQYLRINVVEVYENQFISYNNLTEELVADFSKIGTDNIVGYASYFKLINSFEKTVYWSREKVEQHAHKYSQAYKSATGLSPWKDADQFHEMAKKTVLKNTLSKWGILSIEIQKATISDQSIINNVDTMDVNYIDNSNEAIDKEQERAVKMINDCQNKSDLLNLKEMFIAEKFVLSAETDELFNQKLNEYES
jgi:recombination protein RecT